MNDEERERDLRDIVREETSRGRRPVDTDEIRRQRELRESLLTLIRTGDLKAVTTSLRENGWTETQIDEVAALWRQLRL